MRTRWKRQGHSRWFWKRCLASWRRKLPANCAFRRSESAPARTATGRFLWFTIFWVLHLTRRRNLRASMRMLERPFPRPCANTAMRCARADFLRTPSLIMRRNLQKIARASSSRVKPFTSISTCNEELEMTPQEMRTLYDYNAWANHRSLEAASALTTDQFVQPMGSSFASVRDTLAHIYGAEWIWLERFQGRSPASLPNTTQFKDVASLRERWNEQESRLLGFVRGLTQSDLDRVIEYKTLKFGVYSNPLWESMQHLANHGTYHRGQVTTLLRQLGAHPILTDLMHFYRERATAAGA